MNKYNKMNNLKSNISVFWEEGIVQYLEIIRRIAAVVVCSMFVC